MRILLRMEIPLILSNTGEAVEPPPPRRILTRKLQWNVVFRLYFSVAMRDSMWDWIWDMGYGIYGGRQTHTAGIPK